MSTSASSDYGTNSSNVIVLVEKHYIPIDLYQQIYGGQRGSTGIHTAQPYTFGAYSAAGSTTGGTTRTSRTTRGSGSNSSNLFQTVIENFFPRSSQTSNVSTNQSTSSTNSTNTNTNNTAATSTSTGNGTRRVLVSDVYLDTSGSDEAGLLLFNTLFRAAMGGADADSGSSRGLTASEISRNSETYEITGDRTPYSTHGGSLTCSICTSEYESGDDIRRLNRCRHEFHETCIDTWLSSHNTCPVCRSAVIANIDNID